MFFIYKYLHFPTYVNDKEKTVHIIAADRYTNHRIMLNVTKFLFINQVILWLPHLVRLWATLVWFTLLQGLDLLHALRVLGVQHDVGVG